MPIASGDVFQAQGGKHPLEASISGRKHAPVGQLLYKCEVPTALSNVCFSLGHFGSPVSARSGPLLTLIGHLTEIRKKRIVMRVT
jgi:hypothetical protein